MQHLIMTRADGVATVTLNRPEVRNAFNDVLIRELTETFTALGRDESVRVIVLAASGKAFCAGADLAWMERMAHYSHAENLADAMALATMLRTIHECPVPVIARVQGDAFAGGVGLVAACDMVVAAEHARFCLSEVRLGLIPATIAPYVMAALGRRMSQRYFLTAEVFSAQAAALCGLVHEVTGADALDEVTGRYCAHLIQAAPTALAACKRLLRDVGGRPVDDALVQDTAARIADIRASAHGREGMQAFLNKTRPSWLNTKTGEAS
ncbi:enoyl-CoA hydratase/isomerase family protein [Xanthobacter sp. TB0136]|uniref:enoyl-CoA hydratase/isomerase family protein n=1 Tax=Xanthobacter sp. TB0136 TaxID=3459177 RepID=UPI004039637D